MKKILELYYANNAQRIKAMVNQIFHKKYGGIIDKDMSEFYSVANDVFADIILNSRYNPSKGNFDDFLYISLSLAIIDEIKHQTRDKRTNKIEIEEENESGKLIKRRIPVRDISLDTPITEGDITIGETLADSYNIEKEIFCDKDEEWHTETKEYLNKLSPLQREIALMLSEGIESDTICQELHITKSHYENSLQRIVADEKIKPLRVLIYERAR